MDVFDSATPEMKRMRNQRKDSHVLEQMMTTSLEVEPAEISYHPNGEFRLSRYIFGPLSIENSPVCILFSLSHILTRRAANVESTTELAADLFLPEFCGCSRRRNILLCSCCNLLTFCRPETRHQRNAGLAKLLLPTSVRMPHASELQE